MTELTTPEYQTLLRQDLTSFIARSFYEITPQTKLSMAPYIEALATKLEACRQGKIKRLIVNMPPRHLKSIATSVAFPAWLLGHDPSLQIICASYGQDLADDLAHRCRNVMNSSFYKSLFPTRLVRGAVNDFMTSAKGVRMATSVGGVLTGRGGDFIIIDDPQKPDEALSETSRKTVKGWYDGTLLTRLNNKNDGCIIIVMQRLHQDDLVAHVLEQEAWDMVTFPAIAEEEEAHVIEGPFGKRLYVRKPGDLLDPVRESLVTLQNIRKNMTEYNFSAQYQQNPIPLGGAMVKHAWLQYYELQPTPFDSIVQSWDTASKASELNNFSVCTTWGKKGKFYYLLSVFRKRLEYPDLKRAVKEQAKLYKPSMVLIEDKASGIQLIQELKRDGEHNLNIKACTPGDKDKTMRLHLQTAAFENGQVFLPKNASWLSDYVNELTGFPGAKHDDQVDSTTQALEYLRIGRNSLFNYDLPTPQIHRNLTDWDIGTQLR